ncbi:hypothetical protein [Saccharicrinis fermentans]|uniref:Uncharacterized protein n=1 Tax=Saccharicrinis fermentans DSM 9555 = JCM 21142 TaxID=869213 RepID=W7YLY2_9BACT|nr:hypothetical protein [Saccharicrinis fermentans]GAF05656.1 hypothetical protein JCM21142_104401 [Saccharicrinis fermentans DSM 9555 = JCM 21142]
MSFDKEERLNELYTEFNRTDEFYAQFRKQFNTVIIDVVLDYYPGFKQKDVLNDMIDQYASEILSATESVLYKDKNYPKYRKLEEIEYMDRFLNKEEVIANPDEFSETTHKIVKAFIVSQYQNIIHLSAQGFRLLERYMKMHLMAFISQFLSFVK